jgi:integrase
LFQAALRHDSETYKMTRSEKKLGQFQNTNRYDPITPFIAFTLLSGCRVGEALTLKWSSVALDALDDLGKPSGELTLSSTATKTREGRRVDLGVSPALRQLLTVMKKRPKKTEWVLGSSRSKVEAARKRLLKKYGAPVFTWQTLRSTCATFLTNAPGLFGSASAYRSAKQLGHSLEVAEKHYWGVVRGLSREMKTLESAMNIEKEIAQLLATM